MKITTPDPSDLVDLAEAATALRQIAHRAGDSRLLEGCRLLDACQLLEAYRLIATISDVPRTSPARNALKIVNPVLDNL